MPTCCTALNWDTSSAVAVATTLGGMIMVVEVGAACWSWYVSYVQFVVGSP